MSATDKPISPNGCAALLIPPDPPERPARPTGPPDPPDRPDPPDLPDLPARPPAGWTLAVAGPRPVIPLRDGARRSHTRAVLFPG